MRRRLVLVIPFSILLWALVSNGAERRALERPQATTETPGHRLLPSESAAVRPHALAALDTTVLGEWTFEDGMGGPDPQGWTTDDFTTQTDTLFHVDDFAGMGGAWWPLAGSRSLWCGLRSGDPGACSYAAPPGYGNLWNQTFESVAFPVTGEVTLDFLIRYDTEQNYDMAQVDYLSKSGRWNKLAQYTGVGYELASLAIPADSLLGTVRLRFNFHSDGYGSDEDGYYLSDGAVLIDNLTVSDGGGVVDVQDFEAEAVGAKATADGNWTCIPGVGFGDYAALFDGSTVLQEDSLVTNNTHLWGFFNGSPATYACGGHPEQLAVPYKTRMAERDYRMYDGIVSPAVTLPALSDTGQVVLEFDVYRDLPVAYAVMYTIFVRSRVAGCWQPWVWNFQVYGGGDKDWFRFSLDVAPLIDPGATDIQVSIVVYDYDFYASCHSQSPLVDNVRLSVVQEPPVFVVTTVNDYGSGTLREAITNANASPDLSIIQFDIPGTGPHEVQYMGSPVITAPVIIDGYSQPGAFPNTNPPDQPFNGSVQIVLTSYPQSFANGLYLLGGNSLVRGVALTNFETGIYLRSNDSAIEGCLIGIDPSGSVLGNTTAGIIVDGARNRVGGVLPEQRNIISGNGWGMLVGDGVFPASEAEVYGNWIGLDLTGASAAGNSTGGVNFIAAQSVFGGPTPEEANVVAYSGGNGVSVQTTRVRISGNSIYSNASLGIDLLAAPGGVNPNDPGDVDVGSNDLLNFPLLTSAATKPDSIVIAGTCDHAAGVDLEIQFYANASCDASGHGEGETYLGSTQVNSGAGNAPFSAVFPAIVPTGAAITAIAIDAQGNTSEFSACMTAVNTPAGSGVTVTPVDEGTGTSPVTLTFDNVTVPGNTSLAITSSCAALPEHFLAPDSVCYDLSTTATFSGNVEVCFSYDESAVQGSEANVRLIHYDAAMFPPAWVDITTSLDTLNNTVCGTTDNFSPFIIGEGSVTAVGDLPSTPTVFALRQNVPNPFNPTTVIGYDVPAGGADVSIRIYDVAGRLVRTLVDEHKTPGRYQAPWDGRNGRGVHVATGVYFYRMQAGSFVQTRKMVLLK